MKLHEYTNLLEKNNFFKTNAVIDTFDKADTLFDELKENAGNYYFRGMGEAKYKFYASSQRFWIEKELNKLNIDYKFFINKLISFSSQWENNTLTNFLKSIHINPKDSLALLSYMQHFGIPTPLLDLTSDPLVGLYFSVENSSILAPSNNEIDNYCSLYKIDSSNQLLYFNSDLFYKKIEKRNFVVYDRDIQKQTILIIDQNKSIFKNKLKILNNFNIVNQKGAFIICDSDTLPIEEYYQQSYTETYPPEYRATDADESQIAICWDIHKNLRPYILKKLENENISKDYIYPDNVDFRKKAIGEILNILHY